MWLECHLQRACSIEVFVGPQIQEVVLRFCESKILPCMLNPLPGIAYVEDRKIPLAFISLRQPDDCIAVGENRMAVT